MMELSLLYVHGESIGYGRYGVHLADSLAHMGVDVYDRIEPPGRPDSLNPVQRKLTEDNTRRFKQTNVVCWVSVPTHARGWYDGQHSIISTMWEATRLPESFRENLHHFDQVIVPSEHNLELFGRFHSNVSYVPLGIDPVRWQYVPRRKPGVNFNYLIGGSGARKGTDLAVKAFRKVWGKEGSWGDGPIPRLILKSPRPEDFYGARIDRVGSRLSAEDEVALYQTAHCYLQPSRGEGFGLQPLQAIAQGIPTIATDAHGHKAYSHLLYPLSTKLVKSGYFIYGDAGDWWEPNLDELCDWMLWVYENYDQAEQEAKDRSAVALKEFSWDETARKFVDAIGPDRLATPYQGTGKWFEPSPKRFKVITNRLWKADIAGKTHIFYPGTEYYEFADVKRIMFEAGLLDPRCLPIVTVDGFVVDEDPGLTEEQCEQVGTYTATHSYCPTCSQKLGTGEMRTDDEVLDG